MNLSFPLHVHLLTRTDNRPRQAFANGKAQGITFHMTGNRSAGADAKAHDNYIHTGNTGKKSWHVTVDDKEAWQHLAWTEQGWHTGDGAGGGDAITIGLEICMHEGIDQKKAYEHAAELAAWLITTGRAEKGLFQHHTWSGKECPELIRRDGLWPWFLGRIETYLKGEDNDEAFYARVMRVLREHGHADDVGLIDTSGRKAQALADKLSALAASNNVQWQEEAVKVLTKEGLL